MSSASDAVQLEDRLEKEGPASDYTRKRDLCRLSVAERANGWPTSASETSRASQRCCKRFRGRDSQSPVFKPINLPADLPVSAGQRTRDFKRTKLVCKSR